jgi:hypothetical protein
MFKITRQKLKQAAILSEEIDHINECRRKVEGSYNEHITIQVDGLSRRTGATDLKDEFKLRISRAEILRVLGNKHSEISRMLMSLDVEVELEDK